MADRAVPHDLDPAIDGLLAIAEERFVDLGYLGPAGRLDVDLRGHRARTIRIEMPDGRPLLLQAIGVEADGRSDVASVATLEASSIADAGSSLDPARVFALDRPSGTAVRTGPDNPAWLEIHFAGEVSLGRITLRNVPDDAASLGRGIRILAKGRWRSQVVYDGGEQLRAWKRIVASARAEMEEGGDTDRLALLTILDLTVRGKYARARLALPAKVASDAARRAFRVAINRSLLPDRGLEWTDHGPQRTFRTWSAAEKSDYIRATVEVVDTLALLTPNVCFGFGSVLAVVRDRQPIPHDDDLDVIVAFEPHEAASISEGLRLVEDHYRAHGFEVTGPFVAHRHVRRPGHKPVDVFVGLFEGDLVSWYPSSRRGLARDVVFPPRTAEMLGIACPIPAQPEVYLERIYGTGWRVPDPLFAHPWNRSEFADIAGTAPSSAAPGDEDDA